MLAVVALFLDIIVVMAGLYVGSAQDGEPDDGFQPGFPGLRYNPPDRPAAISRDRAIQLAKERLGPEVAAQATAIIARHVLLSDSHAYRVDESGVKHYLWQKVPVWVVTFEGVNVPPRRSQIEKMLV